MSLDSILKHILDEAGVRRQEILRQARKESEALIQEARVEADSLYQGILNQAMQDCEKTKERLLVDARLGAKKDLLLAKQELIGEVFAMLKAALRTDRLKKQQVLEDKIKEAPEDIDFYLAKLRQDYETEIAEMLFK